MQIFFELLLRYNNYNGMTLIPKLISLNFNRIKKIAITFFAIAMIGGTVASCKKDNNQVDCTSALKKATDAATAYAQNQSSANCKTYKSALSEYIQSSCFTSLSADQKAQYQKTIESLTCTD